MKSSPDFYCDLPRTIPAWLGFVFFASSVSTRDVPPISTLAIWLL